ncbi:hypothetical protein [Alkalihalobacillus deserti]|uniref:hypothetical protein n=1 Tax=Alkalihalobacillus deserti TaxID=2879466 RepID=UPI001D14528D|nr:hypothetical protein [Alkalihalobacillus deserti]
MKKNLLVMSSFLLVILCIGCTNPQSGGVQKETLEKQGMTVMNEDRGLRENPHQIIAELEEQIVQLEERIEYLEQENRELKNVTVIEKVYEELEAGMSMGEVSKIVSENGLKMEGVSGTMNVVVYKIYSDDIEQYITAGFPKMEFGDGETLGGFSIKGN